MRIVLVRHAEAAPGEPDELRALTSHGREQARRLGEQLRTDGITPDAVLSSPLLRARETAAALGLGETVVVVGHQPDCGQITAALRGGAAPAFPPAGAQIIDL